MASEEKTLPIWEESNAISSLLLWRVSGRLEKTRFASLTIKTSGRATPDAPRARTFERNSIIATSAAC